MPKFSPTGKPLCNSCRRLATHRLPYHSRAVPVRELRYSYQCDEHTHSLSEPLPTPQEEPIDEETDFLIELDRYYLDGLLSGDDYARILNGKVV
jgi:hypothetical protein